MFILTGTWVFAVCATVLVHWLLPARFRGWWIVAASAAFLGYMSPVSLGLLAALTALFYAGAARPEKIDGRRLVLLILAGAGALIFYKARAAFLPEAKLDLDPLTEDFIIPLGLSYYALRCIHYAVEKYRGTIPAHDVQSFAQYLFFLPTFMAGPIHRFHAFHDDLARKRWDPYLFAQGLERMLLGYVKVAFIANLLVNNLFGRFILDVKKDSDSLGAYLDMLKISMNVYFQFAGYSSIAIGFGMLLGFKVMENFNYPFLARNISDFWARWHISLTSWCRDYVYMGTIAVTRSAGLAAIAAMVAMGLWHEFSLRYLLWGIYQGAGIMIWQHFQDFKPRLPQSSNPALVKSWRIFATLLTVHYVMFGILLAHYSSLAVSLREMGKIVLFWL